MNGANDTMLSVFGKSQPGKPRAENNLCSARLPSAGVTPIGIRGLIGKPVGQNALSYCGGRFLLRPVTFETVNALGAGQFYDGLPVDCPAIDELERDIGDPLEASLASALGLVENGSCPVGAVTSKPAGYADLTDPPLSASASPGQRYAGLF